jgi:hypothetical protein
VGADDQQGGQGEQPGKGCLGAGRALYLVRQSEVQLVVGEQVVRVMSPSSLSTEIMTSPMATRSVVSRKKPWAGGSTRNDA